MIVGVVFCLAALAASCSGTDAAIQRDEDESALSTLSDAGAEIEHHDISLVWKQDASGVRLDVRDELQLVVPRRTVDFWLTQRARIESVTLDGEPVIPRHVADVTEAPFDGAVAWRVQTDAIDGPRVLSVAYRLHLPPPPTSARSRQMWADSESRVLHLPHMAAWYPRFPTGTPPVSIEARLPEDIEPLAEGRRIQTPAPEGQAALRFESTLPSQGLTFVAGPWVRTEREAGGIRLRTLLPATSSRDADRYLDVLEHELGELQAMLGDYPHPAFSLVEIDVDAVHAVSGGALIDPSVMGRRRLLTSGLRHELLHNWFGHSVFLGPGGNWIEGLVTYLAEHHVHASHSADAGRALRKRLLHEHQLEATGLRDLPVTVFRGLAGGNEAVGYAKVAMIFHALRRRVGEADFYEAVREVAERFEFEDATWDDVLLVFEEVSGQRLARFSIEWLERTGAPTLELVDARNLGPGTTADVATAPHRLEVSVRQSDPPYKAHVPVAIELVTGTTVYDDLELPESLEATLVLDVPAEPIHVHIDPNYDVFRALNLDELPPTLRETMRAEPTPGITIHPASAEALQADVELAMALTLGGELHWRSARDVSIPPDAPTVYVVRVEDARALIDSLDVLTTSDTASPVSRGCAVEPLPVTDGRSVVVALRSEEGVPWILAFMGSEARAGEILARLPKLEGWSVLVYDGAGMVRRALWCAAPESMARDVRRAPDQRRTDTRGPASDRSK